MLEKHIEAKVCDYARERGLLVYKFTSPARAAVPDRLFVLPGGRVFFIEFKRKGQRPTPPQTREHARLQAHGVTVLVINDVLEGLRAIDGMLEG